MSGTSSRYTVIPKQCLDVWVESIGISKLNDEICGNLAEDATYRIRETVHNAVMFMKHAKRTCLTTEDFNNALKEMNTEIIYGHGDAEALIYKAIPFKDGRVCYVDEKDKNLRDIALDSVYPMVGGETIVKGNWLALEGKIYSTDKTKEDINIDLNEPISSYFSNITHALLSHSKHLRKVALMDLRSNNKLQVVLPHLITFLCSKIKLTTAKKSFSSVLGFVLLAINALIENDSVLLVPYIFELMKSVLIVVSDVKLCVEEWNIHHTAAFVLVKICSKYSVIHPNLLYQLLKMLNEKLTSALPIESLFGVISSIKFMGYKAINEALLPHLKNLICYINSDSEEKQNLLVQDSLCDALASLFINDCAITETCFFSTSDLYNILYEQYGERFLSRCLHVKHIHAENKTSKVWMTSKNGNNLQILRQSSGNFDLIKEELKKLSKVENKLSPEILKICKLNGSKVKFEFFRKQKLFHQQKLCNIIQIPEEKKVILKVMKGKHLALKKTKVDFANIYIPIF
ncbi:TAF6-like RNA polymerase II p300/CBP-associated factor-associated factor 65 kDa subunit 6L isoform X2 [Hydra vulgaris]|nr:TAF6-like RNA polymerase II p300/CBP-associated factor-associated factor 65 kDa subunit 6L isoform X2 [Hydra vulgaris]